MYLRAEPFGRSRRIHRHISAAHDNDLLPGLNRGIIALQKRFHQVIPGQVFVCGEYAHRLLAGDSHKPRKPCAGADKHRLKAFVAHQLIDRDRFADDDIGLDFHAERPDILHLRSDNLLFRQTELRNPVNKHATRLVQRLENRHVIAHLRQIPGTGQSCGSGTDDRDLSSVCVLCLMRLDPVRSRPVRHKALELPDGDGLSLDAADTFALALALLLCLLEIALFHLQDKSRNIDGHRAALHTLRIFTVQTAGSFRHRLFFIISKTYFLKIRRTNRRLLLANRNFYHYVHFSLQNYDSQCPQPPW